MCGVTDIFVILLGYNSRWPEYCFGCEESELGDIQEQTRPCRGQGDPAAPGQARHADLRAAHTQSAVRVPPSAAHPGYTGGAAGDGAVLPHPRRRGALTHTGNGQEHLLTMHGTGSVQVDVIVLNAYSVQVCNRHRRRNKVYYLHKHSLTTISFS